MKVLKFVGFISLLSLFGCDESDRNTITYIDFPDSKYVVKILQRESGMAFGSLHTYISMGYKDKKNEDDFMEVFHGSGYPNPIIFWRKPKTLMIILCNGSIHKVKPEYYDLKSASHRSTLAYIQAITSPQIKIDGNLYCDVDPDNGY